MPSKFQKDQLDKDSDHWADFLALSSKTLAFRLETITNDQIRRISPEKSKAALYTYRD